MANGALQTALGSVINATMVEFVMTNLAYASVRTISKDQTASKVGGVIYILHLNGCLSNRC